MSTTKAVVGQEAVIVTPASYAPNYKFGKVTKVTPSGQVEVTYTWGLEEKAETVRFTGAGRLIDGHYSGSEYRRPYLSFDIEGIRAQKLERELRQRAVHAVNAIKLERTVGDAYCKADLLEVVTKMEALVKAAREAVEAMKD